MGELGEPADVNVVELVLPYWELSAEELQALQVLLGASELQVVIDPDTLTTKQTEALGVLLLGAEVRELKAAGMLNVAPHLTGPVAVTDAGRAALAAGGGS